MYIIQLARTSWVADWEGDPGRTLVLQNAKIFSHKSIAERTLKGLSKRYEHRDFNKARIIEVEIIVKPPEPTLKDCKPLTEGE